VSPWRARPGTPAAGRQSRRIKAWVPVGAARGRHRSPWPESARQASARCGGSRYLYDRLRPGRPARTRQVSMKHDSRINSLVLEMVGSVAICGFAYAAEVLVGARRRRATA
jgi:hypothetical protein